MKTKAQFNLTALAMLLGLATLLLPPVAAAAPGDLDSLDVQLAGTGGDAYATVQQPDGKLIIAGQFTNVLGVVRSNIARLNADGTLDAGFNPNANSLVQCVAVQPDGKVLLGGYFTTLQPNGGAVVLRQYLARLNADGTVDSSFNPSPNGFVNSMAVQPDGKILGGGDFTTPQGVARNYVARLNADGCRRLRLPRW